MDVSAVPAARLAGLARYGMTSKAPTLRELETTRQTATLLATVRHLRTATVDDALDLLDVLMATRLLARAQRAGREEKRRTLPRLRRADRKIAATMDGVEEDRYRIRSQPRAGAVGPSPCSGEQGEGPTGFRCPPGRGPTPRGGGGPLRMRDLS